MYDKKYMKERSRELVGCDYEKVKRPEVIVECDTHSRPLSGNDSSLWSGPDLLPHIP